MSASIDWAGVRARLAAAAAALEGEAQEHGARAQRTLHARAAALAQAPARVASADALTVLAFTLAEERYAIETRVVREVRKLDALAALPCTPPFVAGVCSVRGEILSLIDLGRLVGLTRRSLSEHDRVIVLEHGAMRLGMLADAIGGVATIDPAALGPLPAALAEGGASWLRGVTREGVALVDGAALLGDARIVVREDAG